MSDNIFLDRRSALLGGACILGIGGAYITGNHLGLTGTVSTGTPKFSAYKCAPQSAVPPGRPISEFLDPGFDRSKDDISQSLAQAARWSARNGTPVIISGSFLLRETLIIDEDSTRLFFDCADLSVRDDGRPITTRYGDTIPIAIYVVADNVSLLGNCRLKGLGTPGKSFLNGVYGEEVSRLSIGNFTLQNMALGLHFMCCDYVKCGDTNAISMWGLQGTKENPNGAGSAEIISGCRWSQFGNLNAVGNEKPARYLSVGKIGGKISRDNFRNSYGLATVSSRAGSAWSQVTGIRSSVDSKFAGGVGNNVSFLLNIQQYRTDDPYSVTGNDFGDWEGTVVESPESSVDAGLNFWVEDGARPIGTNRLGRVSVKMQPLESNLVQKMGFRLPQNFGLWSNSGVWDIESLDIEGFTFGIYASDCKLVINRVRTSKNEYQVMRYGRGLTGEIGSLMIESDITGPSDNSGLIRPVDLGLSDIVPNFHFGRVEIKSKVEIKKSEYVLYDHIFSKSAVTIGTITGRGSRGQILRD